MAKKCIAVQAQPNQRPAVLVVPRCCTASAGPSKRAWGSPSHLPPPARQSRNYAHLFITSPLTSYPQCPARHPELLPYARAYAGPVPRPQITEVSALLTALSNINILKSVPQSLLLNRLKNALLCLPCFLQRQYDTNQYTTVCYTTFQAVSDLWPWTLFGVKWQADYTQPS